MNRSIIWMTSGVLAVVVAVGLLLRKYPLEQFIDAPAVGDFIISLGALGMFGFVFAGTVFTAFGLPRQLLAFVGGYTWGVVTGVALGTIAAVFGALLTLLFARYCARPYVLRRFPEHIAAIDKFTLHNLFLKILLIRFLPFGTNLATNLAAGVTDVSIRPFLLASLFGFIPQMAIFALTGHGVSVGSNTQIIVAGVLFLISGAIGLYLYRQGNRNNSNDSE